MAPKPKPEEINESSKENIYFMNVMFIIRNLLNVSSIELSNLLHVSRQSIYNWETGKVKLTYINYIAIRKVIEDLSVDCLAIKYILEIFVDNPNKYRKTDKDKILKKILILYPSVLKGTATKYDINKILVDEFKKLELGG